MTTIEKIKKKHGLSSNEFHVTLENFYNNCFERQNSPHDIITANEYFEKFCAQIKAIIRTAVIEAKIEGEADIYWSDLKDTIPVVHFVHEDDLSITVGLFRNFFISIRLNNAKMSTIPDKFWILFSSLYEIGDVKLQEETKPSIEMRKKYPYLFNKRGVFDKLMRNHFLNQLEPGYCKSLGVIKIGLSSDTKFDNLLLSIVRTVEIYYCLHQALDSREKENKK